MRSKALFTNIVRLRKKIFRNRSFSLVNVTMTSPKNNKIALLFRIYLILSLRKHVVVNTGAGPVFTNIVRLRMKKILINRAFALVI